MPIIVHKNISFVVSRAEFLREYKKYDKTEKSVLKQISNPGFDFSYSVLVITEIFEAKKKNHENDFNKKVYSFNYQNEDAQSIALELIIFFSKFYRKIKVLDSENSIQTINEYLLPFKKIYFQEKSKLTIKDGDLEFTIFLKQIKQIKGIVNNFIVFLDNYVIHFCSDIQLGKFIKIVPNKYEPDKVKYYSLNDNDYIFERNKPSKFKLSKFRKNGFLVMIQ